MTTDLATPHVLAFEEAEGFGGAFVDLAHIATTLRDRGARVAIARTYDHACWRVPELEGIELLRHPRWDLSARLMRRGVAARTPRILAHGVELLASQAPRAVRYAAWIRRRGVTAVLLNNGLATNAIGAMAARLAGVPVLPYFQGLEHGGRLFRSMVPWVERGFAVSAWTADRMAAAGMPRERLAVLYPGVELPADGPLTRPRRREPGAPVRVGMVGMLTRWKGQVAFLDAFARAAAEVPGLEAWLFGAAVPGQEGYAREVAEAVERRGLGRRVRFIDDRRTPESIYPAVDFTVHSSTSPEPFGRVMIEAMAFGRPVITAGDGGSCESVRDGETGFLAHPSDPALVAQRMITLARDADRREEMGRLAREDVAERFTYPGVLRPILEHFGL